MQGARDADEAMNELTEMMKQTRRARRSASRAPSRAPGALERRVAPWLAPVALIATWEALSGAGVIPPSLLPSPVAVLVATVDSVRHGQLVTHLAVSALRATAGLAIGASIGVLFGLAVGLSRTLQLLLDSPLQMLR